MKKIIFMVLFVFSPVFVFSQNTKSALSESLVISTSPVVLSGKTVITLRSRLLSLSSEERAKIVSERVRRIASDLTMKYQNIEVSSGELVSDVVLGDMIIMSVTENDAKLEGISRNDLALRNAKAIKDSIDEYRKTYSVKSILVGSAFAVLFTLILFFVLKFISKAYQWGKQKIQIWTSQYGKPIKIQDFEIIPLEKISVFFDGLLGAGRFILIILSFYVYLTSVLGLFPATKDLSGKLFHYLVNPLTAVFSAIFGYIPNLLFVIVIVVCVHYILKVLHLISKQISYGNISFPGFYPEWAEPTFEIFRFVAWAFSLVVIFPYLPGSDSPAFKGVSVFLGVLFSLGSTSAIANAVAGIILTYMRPFKLGDRVKIVDTIGDVVEKGILVTRIRTIKNVNITIPNSLILGTHIVNYTSLVSEGEGLILNTSVTIGYDVPWKQVHDLLINAALSSEGVEKEPKPFVLQTALNDYYVAYEINAYTRQPEKMAMIYSKIHQNIQDQFAVAGVEILSPAYHAIRDANAAVLPDPSKGSAPEGFKIRPFLK